MLEGLRGCWCSAGVARCSVRKGFPEAQAPAGGKCIHWQLYMCTMPEKLFWQQHERCTVMMTIMVGCGRVLERLLVWQLLKAHCHPLAEDQDAYFLLAAFLASTLPSLRLT